jgi:hypothetical protein
MELQFQPRQANARAKHERIIGAGDMIHALKDCRFFLEHKNTLREIRDSGEVIKAVEIANLLLYDCPVYRTSALVVMVGGHYFKVIHGSRSGVTESVEYNMREETGLQLWDLLAAALRGEKKDVFGQDGSQSHVVPQQILDTLQKSSKDVFSVILEDKDDNEHLAVMENRCLNNQGHRGM